MVSKDQFVKTFSTIDRTGKIQVFKLASLIYDFVKESLEKSIMVSQDDHDVSFWEKKIDSLQNQIDELNASLMDMQEYVDQSKKKAVKSSRKLKLKVD